MPNRYFAARQPAPVDKIVVAVLIGLALALIWFGPLFVVAAHAQERSVIEAIIHVESGGKAHLTGKAGEIGLMQIKCRTARGIGFKGKCRDLYDPATNRRWGSAYYAAALKHARGNVCHALTLYNRGIYARPGPSSYCTKVIRAMR